MKIRLVAHPEHRQYRVGELWAPSRSPVWCCFTCQRRGRPSRLSVDLVSHMRPERHRPHLQRARALPVAPVTDENVGETVWVYAEPPTIDPETQRRYYRVVIDVGGKRCWPRWRRVWAECIELLPDCCVFVEAEE